MTPEEVAWAAGFFEGEGCISPRSKRGTIQIAVTNKDLQMLERFQGIVGGGAIYGPHGNECYRWASSKKSVCDDVILLLWPWLSDRRRARYLELRQRQAEWAAEGRREKYLATVSFPNSPRDRAPWDSARARERPNERTP